MGPVALGTLIIAVASWTAQWIFVAIEKARKEAELQESRYIELFQNYKKAHRRRWISGSLLDSALRNGFSSEVIQQRKSDYDNAYVLTNTLFPDTRDYLDGIFGDRNKSKQEDIFKNFFGKDLLDITRLTDRCITRAYAVRYDWDFALWNEKIDRSNPKSSMMLKTERDNVVSAILATCKITKTSTANYLELANIYYKCADTIFGIGQEAINKNLKSYDTEFNHWKSESERRVKNSCTLDRPLETGK